MLCPVGIYNFLFLFRKNLKQQQNPDLKGTIWNHIQIKFQIFLPVVLSEELQWLMNERVRTWQISQKTEHNFSPDWLMLVKYYIIPDKSIIALVMDSINPFLNNFPDNLVVSNDEKFNLHGFFWFLSLTKNYSVKRVSWLNSVLAQVVWWDSTWFKGFSMILQWAIPLSPLVSFGTKTCHSPTSANALYTKKTQETAPPRKFMRHNLNIFLL